MRILLAEDDPMIGASVRRGLTQDGFTVDWVPDGRAAELALAERVHDALLLDLGLPRKAGLDVLTSMRRAGDAPARADTHRARRDRRSRRGARRGRRRLSGEALRARRTRGAPACVAARDVRAARSRWSPMAASSSIRRRARCAGTANRSRCRRANSRCSRHCSRGRARSSRARNSKKSSTAGTTRSRATRSRCTSTRCARSSAPTSSATCAASAGWLRSLAATT